MRFEDMSREEKVMKTYRDLQARRRARQRAKVEADSFGIENMYRVKAKQFHARINKSAAY